MNIFRNITILILLLVTISSCSPDKSKFDLSKKISEYCAIYQERTDLEKFMDFYADSIVLEDFINGDRIIGKENLKLFFDWANPNFQKLDSTVFKIENTIEDDHHAVITGYFSPFKWGDTEFESMHFVSILEFNTIGRIVRQKDWVNYPSNLIDYNNRKNSNIWIKEK